MSGLGKGVVASSISKLLQLSNIVFPGDSKDYNDLYGENGLTNTMNNNKNISY